MIKNVYFFLVPYYRPEQANYQHELIALAEGFKDLGINYYANLDYWKINLEGEFLFKKDSCVGPEDCDLVLVQSEYFLENKKLPSYFYYPKRKNIVVFIDAADGWRTPGMKDYKYCDLVLRCHYNTHYKLGSNVLPWAFGLTKRLLESLKKDVPLPKKKKRIVVNFRNNQSVRRLAYQRIIERLKELLEVDSSLDVATNEAVEKLYWEQTGRRHYSTYYERLSNSLACAAFGGYFTPNLKVNLNSLSQRALYKLIHSFGFKTGTVSQFDSWRFWEALLAGCITLHVELSKYGCCLPVMPENGKHYLGFDFDNLNKQLISLKEILNTKQSAPSGREWVLENYSPVATAKRLLTLVER